MKRIVKIVTLVLALSLLVFMSGCEIEELEKDTGVEVGVEVGTDKETNQEDEEEVEVVVEEEKPVKDVELVLGEKAKISPEDIKNVYKNDIEMLLRFNDFSGKKAPDFNITSLDGEETSLSNYEGENIIIEFMGSWCPACVKSTQVNDEFNKSSTNSKIIGIGINDSVETLTALIQDNKITNTEYLLPEDGIMDKYDLMFVPLYVFIDSEGYVQMILAGDASLSMIEEYAAKSFE